MYGTGKKGDGSLMANAADWRNMNQTYTNGQIKAAIISAHGGCKDKKYQNLASNILSNEGKEQALYNPEVEKAAFGTDANWTA